MLSFFDFLFLGSGYIGTKTYRFIPVVEDPAMVADVAGFLLLLLVLLMLLLLLLLMLVLLVFWLLEEEVVGSPKSEARTSSSDALLNERSGAFGCKRYEFDAIRYESFSITISIGYIVFDF